MPRLKRIKDPFTLAYIECALWASTYEDGTPLGDAYTIDDISPETLATMLRECVEFQWNYALELSQAYAAYPAKAWSPEEQAGHDFWLTRNHHGVGFWDRGLPEELGDILTKFSHSVGSRDLYIGDDGLIYQL